jgi:hypothetical protein
LDGVADVSGIGSTLPLRSNSLSIERSTYRTGGIVEYAVGGARKIRGLDRKRRKEGVLDRINKIYRISEGERILTGLT